MNEHQARQKQIQDATRKFLAALSAGQVAALDRWGIAIPEGAKVLYHLPVDLLFDVTNVSPILDPKMPPGMLSLTLSVSLKVNVMANRPDMTFQLMPHLMPQVVAPVDAPGADAPAPEEAPVGDVDNGRRAIDALSTASRSRPRPLSLVPPVVPTGPIALTDAPVAPAPATPATMPAVLGDDEMPF